ncbi:MAG: tetratricopeptide repeat protein [Bacteroidia bacterium]
MRVQLFMLWIKSFLVLLLSVISFEVHSQIEIQHRIDTSGISDTSEFDILFQTVVDRYEDNEPDSGLQIARYMIRQAKARKLELYEGRSLILKAKLLTNKSDYVSSIFILEKAEAIFQKIDHVNGLVDVNLSRGDIYRKIGQYKKAIEQYKICLYHHEKNNCISKIASDYMGIANVCYSSGDYESDMKYTKLALAIARKHNKNLFVANSFNGLGLTFLELGDLDSAHSYLSRALDSFQRIGNSRMESYAYNNLARVHLAKNELDTALGLFEQSLLIKRQIKDQWAECETLLRLAITHFELENFEKSIKFANQSIALHKKIGSIHKLKDTYLCKYESHIALNQFEEAIQVNNIYLELLDLLGLNESKKLLQRMEFEKKMLQDSLKQVRLKEYKKREAEQEVLNKKRKNRIQYSAVTIIVIFLGLLLVILSRFNVSQNFATGLIFIFFILLFEFLLVVLDPLVDRVSEGEVGYKIAINTLLAFVLFGIHLFSEQKIKRFLVK